MEEYDRWKEIIGLMFPRRIIMLSSSICIRKQRSKSMKLFAQILVKFTWHFWNQLHLGIYSAPPLLDRACDISRCFYSCFWKALFPLEFTLVSDTIRFRKQDMPIIAFQRCLSQMLTLFENYSKCRIFKKCLILAFSTMGHWVRLGLIVIGGII